MTYMGVVHGHRIELDESPPLPEGSRVRVTIAIEPAARRGSPAALLSLAGTLHAAEADAILKASQQCRTIDQRLWNGAE